jgi:hypothetical protein
MCNTYWCDGDCSECLEDARRIAQYEEDNAKCPFAKDCNIITVDVKTDKCTTCGKIISY